MKRVVRKPAAKSPDNKEARLAELNRRFHKYEAAAERLKEAYAAAYADMDDRFVGLKRCASLASAQFNLLRKAMEPVKFDMTSGEYFYAKEGRQEVFAVKVSRSESCTLHVTAKNVEAAKNIALSLVEADPRLLEAKGVVAEEVSR